MPDLALSQAPRLIAPVDSSGLPIVGAKLYTYLAGTTTPENTFSNYSGTVNANPVISNARGEVTVWIDRAKAYKFTWTDAAGVPIYTEDQINYAGVSGTSQTFAAGSAAAPSVNFVGATTSGLFSPAANQVGIATSGVLAVRVDSSQNVGIGGTPTTKLDVFGTSRLQGATTVTTGGLAVTAGGISVAAGGATIAGTVAITGATSVAGGTFTTRGFVDNATAAAWNIDTSGRHLNNGTTQTSFAAFRSTSQQTSGTTLIFNTEQFDTGSAYNNATGVFTAPVAGVYSFSASGEFTNATGANVGAQFRIQCSSAGDVAGSSFLYATGTTFSVSTSVVVKLAAAETVQVILNSALSATFVMTTTNYSRFSGALLF